MGAFQRHWSSFGSYHTTISREVKRNGQLMACYRDEFAQERAMARCKKPRHGVIDQLREDWSQETMAGRLKLDHLRSARLRISPEGIYRWIYEDAAQGGSF